MDPSHSTLGRSARKNAPAYRGSPPPGSPPSQPSPPPPASLETTTNTNSSSDLDDNEEEGDIDSETALNTVYNLLSELGDLNRSNRKAAEQLAEQFNALQAQVAKAETHGSENSSLNHGMDETPDEALLPQPPITPSQTTPLSTSSFADSVFHTPPLAPSSDIYEHIQPARVQTEDRDTQSDMCGNEIGAMAARIAELEKENGAMRRDVQLLVVSHKEQQIMARDYEAALAKALRALRTTVLDRSKGIVEAQARYKELLATEQELTKRLQAENADLKDALSNAASAIRLTLADNA
ncbi:hypothetical protein DL89DRAFT_102675 [Linderina pennispora]|uniref:Uncharacterized protein n=1 Tax=Linderina pennispora TaxID=61395 RepID=A0A1Y1WF48_9FUNG|nr:uncharacterized protein DL89DRAFT_102675 [Linderina pennispora]ORX71866.1 hypothetical protein DL89DRAFT_102675 [Linderina pennispora]